MHGRPLAFLMKRSGSVPASARNCPTNARFGDSGGTSSIVAAALAPPVGFSLLTVCSPSPTLQAYQQVREVPLTRRGISVQFSYNLRETLIMRRLLRCGGAR
jgi:hypothetical protein